MKSLDAGVHLVADIVDVLGFDAELIRRLGLCDLCGSFELVQDSRLLRLVGVELQAERTKSDGVESVLDHFESSHLLSHEEHLLASVKGVGDDVCDGLGLTRSRRTVQDEALATESGCYRLDLR